MMDWNVVVTVFDEDGYRAAFGHLSPFGEVARTHFYNVLVMKVADIAGFTEGFAELAEREPGILNDISRLVPAHAVIDFASPEEFAERARAVVLGWCERLAGGSFYVRLHRRGLRGEIASPDAERLFDDAILERTRAAGHPARVRFDDPDHIIDIETVDHRAGLSLWSRDELQRFDFLHVD